MFRGILGGYGIFLGRESGYNLVTLASVCGLVPKQLETPIGITWGRILI